MPSSLKQLLTGKRPKRQPEGIDGPDHGRAATINKDPTMVKTGDLDKDDIVIAVMGPTGSGKSSFIRVASGLDTLGVGHLLKPYTNRVSAVRFFDETCNQHVVLVDTPGFDDIYRSDFEILEMISEWLNKSYKKGKLLSGILYLHRITDNRMARTPLKHFRLFQKVCGKDALDKVYLTTTMWDEVDEAIGKRRLEELEQEYWKGMILRGAQTACCRSDDGSSKNIIRRILDQALPRVPEEPAVVTIGNSNRDDERAVTNPERGRKLLIGGRPKQEPEDLYRPDTREDAMIDEDPTMVTRKGLDTDDIVIAVMGPTGSGKSTFIRVASGLDAPGVGHSLKSCTNLVGAVRFFDETSNRYVVLVDTPGFDDTYISDFKILEMISEWLDRSYKQDKCLSGILYLHRITDNRMARTPLKNLRLFRKVCGRDALDKVCLTTTMWDEVDEEIGKRRLKELEQEHWKGMILGGAQTACCRNDDDSPKNIIRGILDREATRKTLLQKETTGKDYSQFNLLSRVRHQLFGGSTKRRT